MKWAFMTANFVAEEVQYTGVSDWTRDWMTCHEATVAAFHSPQFAYKFEHVISRIKEAGFDAIELWVAQLFPEAATDEIIRTAVKLLEKYELEVVSYTASFHNPDMKRAEAEEIFRIAKAVGAPILANGFHPANRELLTELCKANNIRFGYENHPEKSPGEVIRLVEDYSPWLGSTLDTGWFATHGADPVAAVDELKDYIVHAHLKDILQAGSHDSCAIGEGIVDVKGVLQALRGIQYTGVVTLEHEPYDHDPMPEMKRSLDYARGLWRELEEVTS